MRLAVIPARGGSKRIPRKNIKPFAGKPIIVWSIEVARDCGCFDRIVVSTDDTEIAEIARNAGADVPFMRPPALADDHTGTIEVVRHAAQWHADVGNPANAVCCIYATAPFVRAEDLRRGLEALDRSGADFAVSITRYPFPIQRAVRVDAGGHLSMFQPELFAARSQDLEAAYHDAAQFYWGRAAAWASADTLFGSRSTAVILPTHRVHDIDTLDDWVRAELNFHSLHATL